MDLIKQFENYCINWEDKINENEWFFEEFVELITKNLTQTDAYNLISDAVKLVLIQSDKYLCYETLLLLFDIIRISDTTEIPQLLNNEWDNLFNHISHFSKGHIKIFNDIKEWYRII